MTPKFSTANNRLCLWIAVIILVICLLFIFLNTSIIIFFAAVFIALIDLLFTVNYLYHMYSLWYDKRKAMKNKQ